MAWLRIADSRVVIGLLGKEFALLARWPIRNKLFVGLALLVVMVVLIAWGGIEGLYSYRSLVRSLRRVYELPIATKLMQHVGDLRVALSEIRGQGEAPADTPFGRSASLQWAQEEFRHHVDATRNTLANYRFQLADNSPDDPIGDSQREWDTVRSIEHSLERIDKTMQQPDWLFDAVQLARLNAELQYLEERAVELPSYLHLNIEEFTEEARGQYRALIVLCCVTSILAAGMFILLVKLFYDWVFRPLRVLIKGSRKVAGGNFEYRIVMNSHDEMAELAGAMNDMTVRFRTIRDDLDRQVQERTKQVVRSEQLASVGFLAAGVAHEINNPLASIAMAAESLEGRLDELLKSDKSQRDLAHKYLRMIQTEAFRCKEITEKLLDFSRIGEVRRQPVELRGLVGGVIDMIGHLGRYSSKHVTLEPGVPLFVMINQQEIKQVVLNLLVNGLDSLEDEGEVRVRIDAHGDQAELSVTDTGHGMTEEVLEHLFEPFFTRKRGGQGTGLGLSIAYRIVADHGGALEAHSDGPGRGARFTVRLPLAEMQKELAYHYQAA
ncbi:MAG: HAMP domain-containing histidine kinase [Planctomycetes bacterium]|nr:HAMP domain-containing histidine kinase [Planctomycetota bacterium]